MNKVIVYAYLISIYDMRHRPEHVATVYSSQIDDQMLAVEIDLDVYVLKAGNGAKFELTKKK